MATVEEKIATALFDYAEALDLDGLPLALPNEPFPEPGTEKPTTYAEIGHKPNSVSRMFMRGSNPHGRPGILQFTVFAPINEGREDVTRIGGTIAALFPADLPLFEDGVKVTIQQSPSVSEADKTEDGVSWYAVVSIRYDCFS